MATPVIGSDTFGIVETSHGPMLGCITCEIPASIIDDWWDGNEKCKKYRCTRCNSEETFLDETIDA